MARKELLQDIEAVISGAGFENNSSEAPMTFQKDVPYDGLIDGKKERAHFLLFTKIGTIQITAKWQESHGTAIEKLGHTAFEAGETKSQHYVVVCGGEQLVKRAIDYLNARRSVAPKLIAMEVYELESFLEGILNP